MQQFDNVKEITNYVITQKRIDLAKKIQQMAAKRQQVAAVIAVESDPAKANEKLEMLFKQVRDGTAILRQNPGAHVRLPRPIELHRARCELSRTRSRHAKLMQRMENLSKDIDAVCQELADLDQDTTARADAAMQQNMPKNQ